MKNSSKNYEMDTVSALPKGAVDTWAPTSSSPYMMESHNSSYHPLITTGFDPTLPSSHPASPLRTSRRKPSNPRRRHDPGSPRHQHWSPASVSRPLCAGEENHREDGQLPWQSYFPADVTDKLVETAENSPQKAAAGLDTSLSTQCTVQGFQQMPPPPSGKPKKSKRKTKKSEMKLSKPDEHQQQQTTKVFVEDNKPEKTTTCCWSCCHQAPDQYTKMTHEETPQKTDEQTQQKQQDEQHSELSSNPTPANLHKKRSEAAAARKLEYMPVSPQLPDLRAYRHGHNGPILNPYIPPDVVFKIYEHPMKYNHPTKAQKQPRVPLLKPGGRRGKPKRSSGEESSYFSSTEWEEEYVDGPVPAKDDEDKGEEEESSDPWSNNTQVTARNIMSSFKPQLSQKKDTTAAGKKQVESDESGKGPSDLSNEEKTPSNEGEKETPKTQSNKEETVTVRPLTQANVLSMDKELDTKDYGEVLEKTEVLSNSEQELSYKIYRHYGSAGHDDTDTTSGIAHTFESSHDQSNITADTSHIPLYPLQNLIKDGQPESEVSFLSARQEASDPQITSHSSQSVKSMSMESNLDQSADEFGVLTESDFYATGQESDATFGTLSSYGSRKRSGVLTKERLLEMHPCLKLCQEDEIDSDTDKQVQKNTLDVDFNPLDYQNQNVPHELDNQVNNNPEYNANHIIYRGERTSDYFPDPPDTSVIEHDEWRNSCNSSDGSSPPPPPPPLMGSEEDGGMMSEYSTLEMPVPMPLLHYSHLELTCAALDNLPTAPLPGSFSKLKRSLSNLSSPDSISKDSTVTMLSESMSSQVPPPEPALHSQHYYSSSMGSSSNISDASESPQTVVCAMVHSPCQPTTETKHIEFDSDSLVKQLPSQTTDKVALDSELTNNAPSKDAPDQAKLNGDVKDHNGHSNPSQDNVKQTRNHKDKNCVLFDFDDKIVEELATPDTKPPRASVKSPKKVRDANSTPASPAKSRRSGNRHKSSPAGKLSEEKQATPKQSRHKAQPPLNRMLLELPPSSRASPKKGSDTTTHSGSYGAGSYGYTDPSSGSTSNQPVRYAALPPMNIGKCIVKFGEKSVHSVQQPGHFSHPKAIDIFPNRDIAILDSENCTLQIFSEKGVCKKVYQFRSGIIDMIVWDSRTLALLKPNEISMFSLPRYEMDSLRLKNVQFPIAVRKMTLPKQEPVFVVAMVTHVVVYTQRGDFLHTIPSHVDKGYGNLYIKRIGRITVNPQSCDVIIVDIDLRTIYIFGWEGDHKHTIDTKYFPIGPVANPQGIGLDNLGNILIADSFNHRVVQIFQGGVRVLLQYHIEFFPCAVAVTRDNRLVVAMDSEGRSFAGVRVYNYRHAIR